MPAQLVRSSSSVFRSTRIAAALLALVAASCARDQGPLSAELAAALQSPALAIGSVSAGARAPALLLDEAAQIFHVGREEPRAGQASSSIRTAPELLHQARISAATGAVRIVRRGSEAGVSLTPGASPLARGQGLEHAGAVVFPAGRHAALVLTPKHDGIKEDIVLARSHGASLSFEYDLQLDRGLKATLMPGGEIQISALRDDFLLDAKAGDDQGRRLLERAREHAARDVLYTLPAPIVRDASGIESRKHARFELDGSRLRVVAEKLDKLSYPLSIDPTIIVNSGSNPTFELGGNFEGGADLASGPIRTSFGFGIGAWADTLSLPSARSSLPAVAYNGKLYTFGSDGTVHFAQTSGAGLIGSWTGTTSLPLAAAGVTSIRGIGALAYNGYLYVAGGEAITGTPKLSSVIYAKIQADGTLGTWNVTTSLPSARSFLGLVAQNGFLYALGGQTASGASPDVIVAPLRGDGSIGTWSLTTGPGISAQLPIAFAGHGAVGYAGRLYVVGGGLGGSLNTNVYGASLAADGTVGAWTALTSTPTPLGSNAAFAAGGYLYYVGGAKNGVDNADVYGAPIQANGTLGPWMQTTSLPTARRSAAVAVPSFGIYVLGGNTSSVGDLATVQFTTLSRQRGTIRSWATMPSLPTPSGATAAGIRGACAVAINGAIYVIGGLDSTNAQRNTVFRATVTDFDTGSLSAWIQPATSTLPNAVDGHTCEVEKGWIYVIGGTNNLKTVYAGLVSNLDGTIAWSTPNTTALQAARRNHTSVVQDGVVFVIGGENPPGTSLASVENHVLTAAGVFGQPGSTLTVTQPMPQARMKAAAVAEGGYIYVAGGSSDGTIALNSVIASDVTSSITMQPWTAAGTLPAALMGHRMVAHDGLLYVLGTGVGSSATVYAGRLGFGQTSGWTTATPLTTARTDLTAVSIGTSLYALGGASPFDVVYAGKLDSSAGHSNFVIQPPFVTGRDVPAAAATSSFVYLVGGRDASGAAIPDAQLAPISADGTLGAWSLSGATPPSRVGHAVFVVKNKLFHVGGIGTGGQQTSIRSSNIQTDGSLQPWLNLGSLNNFTRAFHSIGYVPPTSANPIPSFYVLGGSSSTSVSAGSLLNTVEYVTLSPDLSVPTVTTLVFGFNLPFPTAQAAAAVVLGGFNNHCLFTIGGLAPNGTSTFASNRVHRALLKPDGSPSSTSFIEVTGLPYGVYAAASVVHGGHIFLIGGKTTPTDGSNVQQGPFNLNTVLAAPVDSSCNLGQWRQVGTTGSTLANHAAAVGNGNVYLLGGAVGGGASAFSTTTLAATLRAPSPIGVYTRLYDLNSSGRPSSFDSVALSSPGFPQPASAPLLQFKSAPIGSVVFGATQDLGPVALGASTAFVPPSMAQAQYLFLRLTLDDSLAVAPIADQPTHVDQINMNYTAAPVRAQLTPASGSYTAGTCQAFTLTLYDGLNNAVPAPAAISFTANFPGTTGLFIDAPCSAPLGAGPSIPASLSTTTFFAKLTQAGGFTGTATDTSPSPLPQSSATYTITAGAPSALAYVNGAGPSNITAGQTMSAVAVRVLDGFGNQVAAAGTSISVALVTPPNGVTLSGTLTRLTDATGVATFNDLSMTLAGSFTLSATSAGLANANGSFVVSNAARAQLAVTVQPPNLVAGVTPAASGITAAQSLNVAVQDQFGNVVVNDVTDVTIALAQAGATLSGTTTVTPLNGIATFTAYSVDKVGTRSFTVSSTGLPSITTATFSITAASAAGLAFAQQPSSAVAGVAIAPAITVNAVDAFGNLATTFTGNVVLTIGTDDSGGGLSLGGTLTRTAATGTATFNDITINKTSKTTGYTLKATTTIGNQSPFATSNVFAITPSTATGLSFLSTIASSLGGATLVSSPQAGVIKVAVIDGFGNTVTTDPIRSVVVALAGPAGATLGGTKTVSSASGIATFLALTVDKVGTGYNLTAATANITSGDSNAFNVAVGPAAKLAFSTQPPVLPVAGLSFGATVQVQDLGGNLVGTSATVALALATNPGLDTLSGGTGQSGSTGGFTFSALILTKATTGYSLRATGTAGATTLTAATSSLFDLKWAGRDHVAFTAQPPSSIASGATFGADVKVFDFFNNVVADSTDLIDLALSTSPVGSALSGTVSKSAIAGLASFTGLSLDKVGLYTLSAKINSFANTAAISTSVTVTAGTATKLAFVAQPTNSAAQVAISPAVQVAVQDANGNTVTTATDMITISLATNPGGLGLLSGTLSVAAVSGVASFSTLKIDKAQTGYALRAASVTTPVLTQATSTTFAITVGTAAQLKFSTPPPGTATAGTGFIVAVAVLDAGGNPTSAAPPTVALALGNNPALDTLQITGSTGGSNGVFTFNGVTLSKTATAVTLVATSVGLTSDTSNAFNVTFGASTKLAFTVQPNNVAAAVAISPAVKVAVQDALGNTVTDLSTGTITMSIAGGFNPGGSALGGTVTISIASGVATFSTLTLNRPGTGYKLHAISSAGFSAADSTAFNVVVGAAAALAFQTQPSNVAATQAITTSIGVVDAAGNLVTTATDTVALSIFTNPSSGTLSGTTSVAAVTGVANFNSASIDKAGGGYVLRAGVTANPGLGTVNSNPFNVTVGLAAKLAFVRQPPATVVGKVAISPSVQVAIQDAGGNLVTTPSASVTLSLAPNPTADTLGGTLTLPSASGVADFGDLLLNKLGSGYGLHAVSGTLTAADSALFAVTFGPATKIAFTRQPPDGASQTALAPGPQVSVQDANGYTVTTATNAISVTLNASNGALLTGTPLVVNAAAGVATFTSVQINKLGSGYTLNASATSLGTATSATFAISSGAANKLIITAMPGNGTAAQALAPALAVEIRDASNNLVSTGTNTIAVAITAASGTAGSTLSGSVSKAAVAGVATFSNLSIDKAGAGYRLTVTSSGLGSDTTAAFTVATGPAAKLVFQTQPAAGPTVAGAALGSLLVAVQDAGGNLVSTATDTIALTLGGNSTSANLGGLVSKAAVAGVATFADLYVDKVGTGYTLLASATSRQGATSTAFAISFGSAHHLTFFAQPATTIAGVLLAPAVQVEVRDGFDNVVTDAASTVALTLTGGAAAALKGEASTAAVAGVATFAALSVEKAGQGYTLQASIAGSPGVAAATSDTFAVTPAAAAALAFDSQPGSAVAGEPIAEVRVSLRDAFGNVATPSAQAVTLSASGVEGPLLLGNATVTPVDGIASFTGLSVDRNGSGFKLTAAAGALASAISNPFDVAGLPFKKQAKSALGFGCSSSGDGAGFALLGLVALLVRSLRRRPAATAARVQTARIHRARRPALCWLAAAGLAAALAFPGAARAENTPTTAAENARGRELMRKGLSLFNLGKYKEAIAVWEEAYLIRSLPFLLYNLAQAYRRDGDLEKALRLYKLYLRDLPEAANREVVERNMEELKKAIEQKNHSMTMPPDRTFDAASPEPKAAKLAKPEKPADQPAPPALKEDGEAPSEVPPSDAPQTATSGAASEADAAPAPRADASAASGSRDAPPPRASASDAAAKAPKVALLRPPAAAGPRSAPGPAGPTSPLAPASPALRDGRGGGIGFDAGLAANLVGKTVGLELLVGYDFAGGWQLAGGALVSPHPGGRFQLLYRLAQADDGGWSLALGPRALVAPFEGGLVLGGGAGLEGRYRISSWLDLKAGAFAEAYKTPTGVVANASSTLFAPTITVGLHVR